MTVSVLQQPDNPPVNYYEATVLQLHYGYYSYYSPVCCSYPTSQLTEVQHTTNTSMLCGMDTRPAVLACLRFFITLFNIILGVSSSQYSQLLNSMKT